ncbi:hypothetical protein Ddye_005317 [Dipteronia dyeriana]|uniref:Uncharacterized protein n=1 Tax=Dipteronia dyeriana TaxID=168575 RepID=A0AAD9XG29_9ROSI|nr:hypothetical protein Ddye_005317 [Dipteronia dyeriana]
MYNRIYAKRWDEAFESNSHVALIYLQSKANSKTNFYCKFNTDEKDSREKLFEFIPQINRAFIRLRNNFFGDEYVSKCKSPVILSHMKPLEEHASSVYTYQNYLDVDEQIMNESKYTHIALDEEDNCRVYHLSDMNFLIRK